MPTDPRRWAAGLAVLVACLLAAPAHAAAPTWRLEQPAPPPGAPFKVALGTPGDLKFWSANRGLLSVDGNSTIPRGLYRWDGVSWSRLSTVCGSPGDTGRIAFAGPDEFWTVSEPSQPRIGAATALCHFVNGQVVASYSTPPESPDPFFRMLSAACNGPSDCWFGGVAGQDPTGERVGAFHLHWDGAALTTEYGPQGRAVSDIEPFGGELIESTLVGAGPENRTDTVQLAEPESVPKLIHHLSASGVFANDPFEPASRAGVPDDGTELLALSSDADGVWAVGGGAASGPAAPEGSSVVRPPIAARMTPGSGFQELSLHGALFGTNDRFADVAALPGTNTAMAALVPFSQRASTNAKAQVATIGADGATSVVSLPQSGAGRGSAARIACPSATECWMVTSAGWLFHYTDGTPLPRDTDPYYASTIDFRPNEAAEQFVPDAPPADDSQLFAPPPQELDPTASTGGGATVRYEPVIKKVKTKLRGLTLTVSFTLTVKARIQVIATRRGKTVAKSKKATLRAGKRSLRLRLNRRRYPTRLRFASKALGKLKTTTTPAHEPDTIITRAPTSAR
jgi:hypothetical protein